MTTDDARKVADEFRERCEQMGERNGETGRLGQCVAIITSLANQLDDLDGLKARVAELEAAKAAAETARLAAEEVAADVSEAPPKTKKAKAKA